jgi:hypothetical protein
MILPIYVLEVCCVCSIHGFCTGWLFQIIVRAFAMIYISCIELACRGFVSVFRGFIKQLAELLLHSFQSSRNHHVLRSWYGRYHTRGRGQMLQFSSFKVTEAGLHRLQKFCEFCPSQKGCCKWQSFHAAEVLTTSRSQPTSWQNLPPHHLYHHIQFLSICIVFVATIPQSRSNKVGDIGW